jgi:hypothetical protein
MAEHTVGLYMIDRGERAEQARAALADALGGARLSEPDGTGAFEATLEAGDQEAALGRVWDAIAAAGADDHVAILEHPDLPEHWRARASRPGEA